MKAAGSCTQCTWPTTDVPSCLPHSAAIVAMPAGNLSDTRRTAVLLSTHQVCLPPSTALPAAIVAMPAGNLSDTLVNGERALETAGGPVAYSEALSACRQAVSCIHCCILFW